MTAALIARVGLSTRVVVALALATVSGGCGGGRAQPESQAFAVRSPALGREEIAIPDDSPCKERSIWFPLRWTEVPDEAAEIVVTIAFSEFIPEGPGVNTVLSNLVVIGGLDPATGGLPVGKPPEGAFIASMDSRSTCPSRSTESGVVFTVFAVPADFELGRREEVDLSVTEDLDEAAVVRGTLSATYGSR